MLPHFDYYSSVYFGNFSKAVSLQMEKFFNKESKQVLDFRLDILDLGKQLSKLNLFDILLWKARLIEHFCSFSYSLLRQNRASKLLSCFSKIAGRNLQCNLWEATYYRNQTQISEITHFGCMGQRFSTSAPYPLLWTK